MKRLKCILLVVIMSLTCVLTACKDETPPPQPVPPEAAIDVHGQVVIGAEAAETEVYAAQELSKYIKQLSGKYFEVVKPNKESPSLPVFYVGKKSSNSLIAAALNDGSFTEPVNSESYTLHRKSSDKMYICGADDSGVLYGVYGFLDDHLGMGFYYSGDTFPADSLSIQGLFPDIKNKMKSPVQNIRGILPWSNFPQSSTSYSRADWEFVIDTAAKMRSNLINMHSYTGFLSYNENYTNFEYNDTVSKVQTSTAATGHHWGGRGFDVNSYMFGAADLFDDYDFGTESTIHNETLSNEERTAKGIKMFQHVIDYAHTRGVKIALGIEIDNVAEEYGALATDKGVLDARVNQIIRDYPTLDYLIVYRSEMPYSDPNVLAAWNACVIHAHDSFKKAGLDIKLAVSGWGILPSSLDGLPMDIIAAPISGYSATWEPSTNYGEREYWACPWTEQDFNSSNWFFPLGVMELKHTVEAYNTGKSANFKGFMCLTWRLTGPIDAKLSYMAKAPWDNENNFNTAPKLYTDYITNNYGAAAVEKLLPIVSRESSEPQFECGSTPSLDNTYGVNWKNPAYDTMKKVNSQIQTVEEVMNADGIKPEHRSRLEVLHSRLLGVKSMYILNDTFGELTWEDMPGAFEDFSDSFVAGVVDISSLGNVVSSQNRLIQERYLVKLGQLRALQTVKAPDVSAKRTPAGAIVTITNYQPVVSGYRIYRNGVAIANLKPGILTYYDSFNGEVTYNATAISANGVESPKSIPASISAGSVSAIAPDIKVVSPSLSLYSYQNYELKAYVLSDSVSALIDVTVKHRPIHSNGDFTTVDLENKIKSAYTVELTPEMYGKAGFEYYIEAEDGVNISRYPVSGTVAVSVVENKDEQPESVNLTVEDGYLKWNAAENADIYRIYRSKNAEFSIGLNTYVAYVSAASTSFLDNGRNFDGSRLNGTYYYKIAAVSRNESVAQSSNAVGVLWAQGNTQTAVIDAFKEVKASSAKNSSQFTVSGNSITGLKNDDTVRFSNVTFGDSFGRILKLNLTASDNSEVYAEIYSGDILAARTNSSKMQGDVSVHARLDGFSSMKDVSIKFICAGDTRISLLSLIFKKAINPADNMLLETFYEKEGVTFSSGVLSGIQNNSYIMFADVLFDETTNLVNLTYSKTYSDTTSMKLYKDALPQNGGELIGELAFLNTQTSAVTQIESISGVIDIFAVFTNVDNSFSLSSFKLETSFNAFKVLKPAHATKREGKQLSFHHDVLQNITNDSNLYYKNVVFNNAPVNIEIGYMKSSDSAASSYVEVWINGKTTAAGGTKICNVNLPPVGTSGNWTTKGIATAIFVLPQDMMLADVYLVFKGGSGTVCYLVDFAFKT